MILSLSSKAQPPSSETKRRPVLPVQTLTIKVATEARTFGSLKLFFPAHERGPEVF